MRCMTLFRYGKSKHEVKEEVKNGFYSERVKEMILDNLEEIEKSATVALKKRIKFPNIQ